MRTMLASHSVHAHIEAMSEGVALILCIVAAAVGVFAGRLNNDTFSDIRGGTLWLLGIPLGVALPFIAAQVGCKMPVREPEPLPGAPDLTFGTRPSYAEQQTNYQQCQADAQQLGYLLMIMAILGVVGFIAGRITRPEHAQ